MKHEDEPALDAIIEHLERALKSPNPVAAGAQLERALRAAQGHKADLRLRVAPQPREEKPVPWPPAVYRPAKGKRSP